MRRRKVRAIAGIALVLSAIFFVFLWGYSFFTVPGPDPPQTTIERETGDVPALAFSSDSRWLAFTDKHSVKLCDMNAGGAVKSLREFKEGDPSCVAFTPDSKQVLVGTWSNRMYVLEIAPGAVRETISFEDRRESRVLNVAVSSIDDWVAVSVNYAKTTGPNSSSSEYAIEVFQLGNSAKRETLIEAGARDFVTFSPSGRLLAAIDREQNLVRVWTMPDAKQVYEIPRSANEFFSIAFDPSSEKLAFGGMGQRVHIWSLAENRHIDSWSARSYVENLAFHPSGDIAAMCNHHRPNLGLDMASSNGATISIWNGKGRRQNTFRAFDVAAGDMAISPNGKHLAASGARHGSWQVKVWDWETASGMKR